MWVRSLGWEDPRSHFTSLWGKGLILNWRANGKCPTTKENVFLFFFYPLASQCSAIPSSWNFPSQPHLRFLKTPLPHPSLWRWRDVTRMHPPPSLSLSHRFHKLSFVWEGVCLTHTSLQTVNQKLLLKICVCNKLAGQFCGWESLDAPMAPWCLLQAA